MRQESVGFGVDQLRDLRHTFEYRCHPAWRQGVELQSGRALVQSHEQRLRENGVANPGRGDDQGFHEQPFSGPTGTGSGRRSKLSVVPLRQFALEHVVRAAIGTNGFAGVADLEKYARMPGP